MTFDECFSRLFGGQVAIHTMRNTQSVFLLVPLSDAAKMLGSQLPCQMADCKSPQNDEWQQ
jgi:hypothetical protein